MRESRIVRLAFALTACVSLSACYTEHKVEISTPPDKPIHVVLDINIKIQEEVKKTFASEDATVAKISNEEAEKALRDYLASQVQNAGQDPKQNQK